MRKIVLSTRVFKKAGDGTAFFSAMKNRYPLGQRILPNDEEDLIALLQRHDYRDEKIGVGIDHLRSLALPKASHSVFGSLGRTEAGSIFPLSIA